MNFTLYFMYPLRHKKWQCKNQIHSNIYLMWLNRFGYIQISTTLLVKMQPKGIKNQSYPLLLSYKGTTNSWKWREGTHTHTKITSFNRCPWHRLIAPLATQKEKQFPQQEKFFSLSRFNGSLPNKSCFPHANIMLSSSFFNLWNQIKPETGV